MVPDSELEDAFVDVLAGNTAAGLSVILKVFPVMTPFTPGEDMSSLTADDLPVSTIAAGVEVAAAGRQSVRDPSTGAYKVNIAPPAGGWEEVTGAGGDYPVTIYGFILVNKNGAAYTIPDNIIASEVFPTPITLTGPGQLLSYGEVSFSFNIGAWY